MEFTYMDITDVTYGIVCHQVNCRGVMGAGVALAIRNKWPVVFTEYRRAYNNGELVLGNINFVKIKNGLCVGNICSQDRYGRKGRFTDYDAVDKALKHLFNIRSQLNKDTGMHVGRRRLECSIKDN